jgi:hypothetical protein
MNRNPYLTDGCVEVQLSKFKLVLMLLGSLVFVSIGIGLIMKSIKPDVTCQISPILIITVGLASIVFFGVCAAMIAYKLPQTNPGIIIDKHGIIDHSSGISSGLIKWEDITDIYVIEVNMQKLIMLDVSNPTDYIQCHTNSQKRKATVLSYEIYGTPLSISSRGLKCNTKKLHSLLTSNWENYKAVPLVPDCLMAVS